VGKDTPVTDRIGDRRDGGGSGGGGVSMAVAAITAVADTPIALGTMGRSRRRAELDNRRDDRDDDASNDERGDAVRPR
jgi:hypothetical protein